MVSGVRAPNPMASVDFLSQIRWSFHSAKIHELHTLALVSGPEEIYKGSAGNHQDSPLGFSGIKKSRSKAIEGIALCIHGLIEACLKVIQKIGGCFKF